MGSFLAGLGIGFGLGVLFAPMSGEQMRATVADRANQAIDTGRSVANQAMETGRSVGQRVQDAVREIPRAQTGATGTEG
jgi:gas vesicle protein